MVAFVLVVAAGPAGAASGPTSTAAAAHPAVALQAAVRATMASPGFMIIGFEQIHRENLTLRTTTHLVYQAPNRAEAGTTGQNLRSTITIGTTKYVQRTTVCPGGSHTQWYWQATVPARNSGTALGLGYLANLLRLPNVQQVGPVYRSVTRGPAPAGDELAFGNGPVVTTVTVTLKNGYVAAASSKISSSKAVLTNSVAYSGIGTSGPVAAPSPSLVFTSSNRYQAPSPPLSSICPAA